MIEFGKIENGKLIVYNIISYPIRENDKLVAFPTEEQFNNNGWYRIIRHRSIGELSFDEDNKIINVYINYETIKKFYETDVINKIRKKYSINEELAILRQRDTKPDEFKEYFDFCESVKTKVKSKYNIN